MIADIVKVTGCRNCPFLGHGAADNHFHKHCAHPGAPRHEPHAVTNAVKVARAAPGCPLRMAPTIVVMEPTTLAAFVQHVTDRVILEVCRQAGQINLTEGASE